MFAELKWLIPVCAATAIAVVALIRAQPDSMPWSRAFIIAAALLMAATPIIASGKITRDGLEITTLSEAAERTSDGLGKLDDRITTTEKKIAELRNLVDEIKTASAIPPDSKAKIDAQIRTINDLSARSAAAKVQFDAIKKELDRSVLKLPGPKLGF
jgi:hypothetical protein